MATKINCWTHTYNGLKVGDEVVVKQAHSNKAPAGTQVYEINRLWDRFIVELVYKGEHGQIYRGGNLDASLLEKV